MTQPPALQPQAPRPRPETTALFAELLWRGLPVSLRARGGSMWPFLRDGDVLTVLPLDRPARLGEVLAVRRGDELVVHRAVRVRGRFAELQGDALSRSDGSFAAADLLGRVVLLRRGAKSHAPATLFPLLAAPLLRLWLRFARAALQRRDKIRR